MQTAMWYAKNSQEPHFELFIDYADTPTRPDTTHWLGCEAIRELWQCIIDHRSIIVDTNIHAWCAIDVGYTHLNIEHAHKSALDVLAPLLQDIIARGAGTYPHDRAQRQQTYDVCSALFAHRKDLLTQRLDLQTFYDEQMKQSAPNNGK